MQDSEDFSDERRESITQLLEDIDELEAEAKTGGVKMEALDSKLDLDSFIDSFIVEEIAKDWDYRLGSYLFFYPGLPRKLVSLEFTMTTGRAVSLLSMFQAKKKKRETAAECM